MDISNFPIDLGDGYKLTLESSAGDEPFTEVVLWTTTQYSGEVLRRFPFETVGDPGQDGRAIAAAVEAAKLVAAAIK